LTVTYDATQGGPHHEAIGDHEAYNDVGVLLDLLQELPANTTLYSIYAYIPFHDYYSTCNRDYGNGGFGCVYELYPSDSAALAVDVAGNYVVVSVAEICNSPCTTNGLQMSAFTSQGGDSVVKTLAMQDNPVFSPLHKLTIATDRKTFIDFYVDNTLLYSNSTMPIDLSGFGSAVELSQRTSINNETSSVTWSNFSAYPSSQLSVSGLSAGMNVVVNGTNGFNETVPANFSSGFAVANVSLQPTNLTISVQSNGTTIATFATSVSVGAELRFVTNVTTSTFSVTYPTTYTTTYATTNVTTYTTTTTG